VRYFRTFPAQAIPFEWLYFSFWYDDTFSEYLGHSSVSRSFVPRQGHGSAKAVACNSKTTGWKLLGPDWKICYDNAQSNSEMFTLTFDLETCFRIFSNSSSKLNIDSSRPGVKGQPV